MRRILKRHEHEMMAYKQKIDEGEITQKMLKNKLENASMMISPSGK